MVSIQHPQLVTATELVCPLKRQAALTTVRTTIEIGGEQFVVPCDLVRPINRRALRPMGELDEVASMRVLQTFLSLLAV